MEKYRQNIFGISEIYELQREGQWVERNRESYREYGYFTGGNIFGPNITTTVDRIDYSNDTTIASVRRGLINGRIFSTATGNSNFGYVGGGGIPGALSIVERIDYSNDISQPSVRGPLSLARSSLAATGNSNFGYFGGGNSTVDRINYANDSATASVRGPLSLARIRLGATGNSNFGYFGGGTSTVDRINYSNDNRTAVVRSPLSSSRYGVSATGNSNFGYFGGGATAGIGSRSTVDRLNYSNDTATISPRGVLSSARSFLGATGNSNFGYFGGGQQFPNYLTTIDRIDYSNDTVTASVRGPLSQGRNPGGATSSASFGGSPVSYLGAPWVATAPYGYFGGGSPGPRTTVERIDYNNDTAATAIRGPLSSSRFDPEATGNSKFGYFAGGHTFSTVDRVDYSNDTAAANTRGPLSLARYYAGATGNSSYGWFGGGVDPGFGIVSVVDRIDYSNDSATALVRGSLNTAEGGVSATGTSNFGYFGGGFIYFVTYSYMMRVDYSNDSITSSLRGPLSIAKWLTSATGTQNFGYWGGGSTGGQPGVPVSSSVDRIDYSNDTQTTIVRGPLSVARRELSATGNQNFGYFGGGAIPGAISTVDRINYSNDTQTASTRGPLSSARTQLAASSSQAYGGAPNTTTDPIPTYIRANTVWNNSNTLDVPYKRVLGSYGYFGGGDLGSPTRFSTVNRIDYSNDTSTASVRGPLAATGYFLQGTGNSNFGYMGTGSLSRINYSNDTSTAIFKNISTSNQGAATGNNFFGYFVPGPSSTIVRMDYSNDNITLSRGNKRINVLNFSAFGNFNSGYFAGGQGSYSAIDRINYFNDTTVASRRSSLVIGRDGAAASANQNYGWIGGGQNVPNIFYSIVDRLDFSNDTTNTLRRGDLGEARRFLAATGNSNFAYFGGGNYTGGAGSRSRVDRIDYSNDTITASQRGSLTYDVRSLAATTNARNS